MRKKGICWCDNVLGIIHQCMGAGWWWWWSITLSKGGLMGGVLPIIFGQPNNYFFRYTMWDVELVGRASHLFLCPDVGRIPWALFGIKYGFNVFGLSLSLHVSFMQFYDWAFPIHSKHIGKRFPQAHKLLFFFFCPFGGVRPKWVCGIHQHFVFLKHHV